MKRLNYEGWLKEAGQYEKAASESADSRFTPTILYNILAMSLESYCMAIMDKYENLPDNHTFFDLVSGLERVIELDKSLKERILDLEKYQNLCPVTAAFSIAVPDHATIVEFREVVRQLAIQATAECVA